MSLARYLTHVYGQALHGTQGLLIHYAAAITTIGVPRGEAGCSVEVSAGVLQHKAVGDAVGCKGRIAGDVQQKDILQHGKCARVTACRA